jgi:hypothetical protein
MKRILLSLCVLCACAVSAFAVTVPGTRPTNFQAYRANATTPLAPIYTASGLVSLSVDAIGTNADSGLVQVNKPVGGTVRAAYLISASTGFNSYQIPNGTVTINGTGVNWDQVILSSINSYNHLSDVTAIVKPIVDAAAAGSIDLTIGEDGVSAAIDGEILAVVFDDPSLAETRTAVIFFGAQNIAGDDFAITLADPAKPADPNYILDLSLGISYGYQEFGGAQVSLITVNDTLMTSSAGGEDDGDHANGALITVGGIGDSDANPADPTSGPVGPLYWRYDDELYSLKPFVKAGDQLINVHTINPSNDDNILFGALYVSGAAIVGEGLTLSPDNSIGPVGSTHTVTAHCVDTKGHNLGGKTVTFNVFVGPHAGANGTAVSDTSGLCSFSYTGTIAGTDSIHASMVDSKGVTQVSNTCTRTWIVPLVVGCPTNTGTVNVAYHSALTATGGTPPYMFAIAGNLPAGLSINDTTGAITGTPTAAGTTAFTALVYDATQGVDSTSCSISIAGAPSSLDCSTASVDPPMLWPPNHKFRKVCITGVKDASGKRARITVLGVTQDEPLVAKDDDFDDHHGDRDAAVQAGSSNVTQDPTSTDDGGMTVASTPATRQTSPNCAQPDNDRCPDAKVERDGSLWLRAERNGHGNGRVYVISFMAVGSKGDTCYGSVSVCVPRNFAPRCHNNCVDDGQKYNSFGPCPSRGHEDRKSSIATSVLPDHVSLSAVTAAGSVRTIVFSLPVAGDVRLSLFDVAGRHVATLVSGMQDAGVHRLDWSSTRVERGMYFARLQANGVTITKSVLVLQ